MQLAENVGTEKVIDLLHEVFKSVEALNPSKDANPYWLSVNKTILGFGNGVSDLWKNEKIATIEGIEISKEIALDYLASEREAIMKLTHDEALKRLIDMHKIDSRMAQIKGVSDNNIMALE